MAQSIGSEGEPSYFNFTDKDLPLRCFKNKENVAKILSYSSSKTPDYLEVHVRVKPSSDESSQLVLDEDGKTIRVKKPKMEQLYTYSNIFKPECTQKEIFDACAKRRLERCLNGENSFIFAYGSSNSGKTFTVQGERNDPGLIPRCLAALFSSLENVIDLTLPLVPYQVSSVTIVDNEFQDTVLQHKKSVIDSVKTMMPNVSKSESFIPFSELNCLKNESEKLCVSEQNIYSVWVSFYEIYNEKVYDLLVDSGSRAPLRLMSDKNKHYYIKDLTHVPVNNLEEAHQIYTYGRYNRSTYSTGINEKSSRSHSVFSIKIICYESSEPNHCILSSFSICDLAGTERANRTGNIGTRMFEAQRINTSFLVLNKCLRVIRENQTNEVQKLVPFRESKLTQILGPALTSSSSSLLMIVTICQNNSLLEETENTLKCSSVAMSLKIVSPPKVRKKMRFSVALSVCTPGQRINKWNEVLAHKAASLNDGFKIPEEPRKFGEESLYPKGYEPDVYKELLEERKKREEAEDRISLLIEQHKLEAARQKREFTEMANMQLIKENKELEDEAIELRTNFLRLQKKHRILRENSDRLETENEMLKELVEDAKEEVEALQKEITSLEKQITYKDEKLVMMEMENESLMNDILDYEEKKEQHLEEYMSCTQSYEDLKKQKEHEVKELTQEIIALRKRIAELDKENDESQVKMINRRARSADRHYSSSSEEFVAPRSLRSKSAVKKRPRVQKHFKNKDFLDVPCSLADVTSSSVKQKKQLFSRSSVDLQNSNDTVRSEDPNQTQSSPGSILKRTLRTGKQY